MAQRRTTPIFDGETLALFERLDRVADRDGDAFKASERELAGRLGLASEWWTVNSVLDKSCARVSCHQPPEWQATRDWHVCRRCAAQLLAAVAAGRVQ